MLVKRALTSNETKISSSGFIERCLIFLMKSVLSLTEDESATVIMKNFSDEFGSAVCCFATSRDYGVHRHVVFVDFRKTIKSCCWGIGVMRS